MATAKKGPGLGPWYINAYGEVKMGTPGENDERERKERQRARELAATNEIVEVLLDIRDQIGKEHWTEVQWERMRNAWVEVALELARVKIQSQKAGVDTSDDKYKDLEAVQVDNFDDAMKVLSQNFLA